MFRREVELHNYVRNFEVTLRRKDGTLLTAMESSFATRNAAGKIERYQGFLLDMTEKKRAEDEIRRRNRELNALNAMAVIATQSFDLDEILNLTLRQVITLLGAETGSIYLCDLDETTFRRRAGWGQRSAERARLSEIKFTEGFGELVTRSRTEVITTDYLPHLPPQVAEFIRADGLASWIWVLLWGKDNPSASWASAAGRVASTPATTRACWSRLDGNSPPPSRKSGSTKKPAAPTKTCATPRNNCCRARKCRRWDS